MAVLKDAQEMFCSFFFLPPPFSSSSILPSGSTAFLYCTFYVFWEGFRNLIGGGSTEPSFVDRVGLGGIAMCMRRADRQGCPDRKD